MPMSFGRHFISSPNDSKKFDLPMHSRHRRSRWLRYPFFRLPRLRIPKFSSPFHFFKVVVLPTLILLPLLLFGYFYYEPHIEIAFYNRQWVTQEIEKTFALGGCFDPEHVSPDYNLTEAVYGARRTEIHAGLPMRLGMDCYHFAGTVQLPPGSTNEWFLDPERKIQYHTYWRVDLAPFGPRQEYMLKSFFATQDLGTSRLILWSNGDLSTNKIVAGYLRRYPNSFACKEVDIPSLARSTALEGSRLLVQNDKKAWVDGDLIRLLLLWNYGGVWVDMDSLLTRDLKPLLEHEFVSQWDCYDKVYAPFNGALMRFRKHSPYLCEAFHIMSTSQPPRLGSTDWGSVLYYKLWKSLVAEEIPPFKVLPFCFTDARSCRLDNRLPDPFSPDHKSGKWTNGIGMENGGGLDDTLKRMVFSVHLHNQWEKEFPKRGWVERLLLDRYDDTLRRHP